MSVTINGTTGIDLIQDGAVSSAAKLATGVVTDTKLNLTANSQEIKDALNATGSAPVYACRAWVNFNGTGTVAIRESGDVSSITDNGVGEYTLNFATAMPDANYTISISSNNIVSNSSVSNNNDYGSARFVGSYRFAHLENAALTDASVLCVAIFR